MTRLRITVLGSGSVGLALAATYARSGVEVTVLARGLAVQQLQQSGITVTGVAGDHQIVLRRLKVCDVESPEPEDVNCDILILATKAYQVKDALS
jgi:2-dehydropantoate 2-reductase